MTQVRIVATSDTYRKAPYYFTPSQDGNSKKWLTGQDINWKVSEEDGRKKFVPATEEDVKKIKNLPLVIDPNESYMVKDKMVFNLDVPADVALLEFLKTQKDIIAHSKSAKVPGRHRYYIENQDEEAKETVSKIDAEFNAITKIRAMTFEEMQAFARVIGIGKVGGLSKTQVEAALYERAKLQPAYVMSSLEDPDRKVKAFLKLLIEKNIVRLFNGKYQYGTEILGLNEMAAIDFLKAKENANMVNEFSRLVKQDAVAA
jgi:hypothetical protein